MSCYCRHPSKLHDNMMPMSPDDYRALTQMVNSEDMAAVVSTAALTHRCYPSMLNCNLSRWLKPAFVSILNVLSGRQCDSWIWCFWCSGTCRLKLYWLVWWTCFACPFPSWGKNLLPHAIFNCWYFCFWKCNKKITEIYLKPKSEAMLHGVCHDWAIFTISI